MELVDSRRRRTRSIRINGIEDTPKTVLIDALLQEFLADWTRSRMADAVLITALSSSKHIHCCTIKKFDITQLLNDVYFGVNGIIRVSGSERTAAELIHCACENTITLAENSDVAIGFSEIQAVIGRNIGTQVLNILKDGHFWIC